MVIHFVIVLVSKNNAFLNTMLLQDASFSMPLCHSKVVEVTAEDLVALSEIERNNLGKVRIRPFCLSGIS